MKFLTMILSFGLGQDTVYDPEVTWHIAQEENLDITTTKMIIILTFIAGIWIRFLICNNWGLFWDYRQKFCLKETLVTR